MGKLAFFKFFVVLLFLGPLCHAQKKVKYKDIWGLLNVKQFEAAEPFLKSYLKENTDNPNAYLFMGMIYQDKSGKDDVLKQTRMAIAHMDSAIYFYTKAYQTITEKEIKRNDEYYQTYNRRDLRTGEYGVKLSDIQFDLEKRMEAMREKTDRVKMIKYFFVLSDSMYKKARVVYVSLQDKYEGEKEFFLRADEATVKSLVSLGNRYDSAMKAFDQYKGSVMTVGKIGYNQVIVKKEIKSFKQDGATESDFYSDEVTVWDYRTFVQNAKHAIEDEILPMRDNLITYDMEINKLREKLNKDSVSVKNDLTKLIDKLLMDQLKRYDPQPLPMDVFSVKIADLDYRSTRLENSSLKDSLDLHMRLKMAREELKSAKVLDSLAGKLLQRDMDKDVENYTYFVNNTYSNATVLKSFIKVIKEYSDREVQLRKAQVARHEKAMQWLVINAVDSIPLFTEAKSGRFRPLTVVSEKFTTGIHYIDSVTAQAYFYSITPSRVPDMKITFPVVSASFRQSQFPNAKSLTFSDPAGQIFFVLVYSEKPGVDNKFPATLAKIYRSDGLAWSTNYTLPFVPKELIFRTDTGECTIRADAQESVIDKNGKQMR